MRGPPYASYIYIYKVAWAATLEMFTLAYWRAPDAFLVLHYSFAIKSMSLEIPSTSTHHPCTRNPTATETKQEGIFSLKEFSRAVCQQRTHQSVICSAGKWLWSLLQPAQRPYCSRSTESSFSNKASWITLKLFFPLSLSPSDSPCSPPCFYWAGIIHIKLCFPCGRVPKLGGIFAHLSMMKLFIRQRALP